MMDRTARLLSTSDRYSRILEIGAGYNPTAPRSGGWTTHVVDHASRAELCAKYATAGVDVSLIEEVDTIWRGGALHEALPATLHGRFDTLIASHVIEHIPDLAGFLISAAQLLRPTGAIVLAVPDRRFCFDYFKPIVTTGDILEARVARRVRHTLRTAWNHLAYSVTSDGTLGWPQQPIGKLDFMAPFALAAAVQQNFADDATGPYDDYHVWHFTPASFALVILELGQLGVTDWRIESLHGPEGFEFFAVLRRGAERTTDLAALQTRRMSLLQQQLQETQAQLGFALPGAATQSEAAQNSRTAVLEGKVAGQLEQLSAQLADQAAMLREMRRAPLWLRTALRPARRIWRKLRQTKRPQPGP